MPEQCCVNNTVEKKKPSKLKKTLQWFIMAFIMIFIIIISYAAWFIIIAAVLIGLLCVGCIGLWYKIRGKI
jgi:hypothetical protein